MMKYLEEIRLSRALAMAIHQEIDSFGKVVPYSVLEAYNRLKEYYDKEIEEGIM